MLAFLAVMGGALIALTVVQNGDLAAYMGNAPSTVLVHVIGLVTVLLWMGLRREKLCIRTQTPWYAYFGGVLGVLTVYGSNQSFLALGVSVAVAMMLFGQTVMSVAVDQFGWFGAPRRPFRAPHLLSLTLIAGGIAVMFWL